MAHTAPAHTGSGTWVRHPEPIEPHDNGIGGNVVESSNARGSAADRLRSWLRHAQTGPEPSDLRKGVRDHAHQLHHRATAGADHGGHSGAPQHAGDPLNAVD